MKKLVLLFTLVIFALSLALTLSLSLVATSSAKTAQEINAQGGVFRQGI
jgi:CHASE3 domain sensor protein